MYRAAGGGLALGVAKNWIMVLEAEMTVEELLKLDDGRAAAEGLYRFESLHLATEFAVRALKPHFVLHGDDERYWVTNGRLAGQLELAGYEVVG